MRKKIKAEKQKKESRKMLNPLEFALSMEVKSVDMYLRLAIETKNPLGKKLFYSLAGEEIEHAKKVDELFNNIDQNNGYKGIAGSRPLPSVESEMKGFFLKSRAKHLEKGNENISGYKIAIKLEKESYSLYAKLYESSQTGSEREFYKNLMKEEKTHLEAVVNVYSYLTRTDDWFQEEESKVWNWMNI
ncbi:MAG: ferritin family protein [Elusimicrobia bacterium]|nr:ferritin family protein [Elusimicrobiota bacterium]